MMGMHGTVLLVVFIVLAIVVMGGLLLAVRGLASGTVRADHPDVPLRK